MSQENQVWIKNKSNGMLSKVDALEFQGVYSQVVKNGETAFTKATEAEVKDWEDGTYWEKYNKSK